MVLGITELTLALVAVGGTALGALIGAMAGGVIDVWLARVAEKREAKVGARLVQVDLALAARNLKETEDDRKWWVFYETPMDGWHAHRTPLCVERPGQDSNLRPAA